MKSFAKSSVATTVTFCSVLCLSLLGVTNSHPANAASLSNWRSYNYNSLGTRYNSTETKINPTTAQQLRISWEFPTEGNVNATPAIYDHKVYAGDTSGNFYSLRDNGQLLWKTKVNGAITNSPLVTDNKVIFGDLSGNIYGLDRQTGNTLWTTRPNPHPLAAIFSSPTLVDNQVVIGTASVEEDAALNPQYPCCSFRGSIAKLNPDNGNVVWQTYTIPSEQQPASGAPIWSTPTYDASTGIIYATTGNNYSSESTPSSDAFIAFDAKTGNIVWQKQLLGNDVAGDPDADFGDSPQIYTLANGEKVVAAGQKNGVFDILDAKTGEVIHQYNLLPLTEPALGFFADSAVADGVIYANGTGEQFTGHLFALKGDGGGKIWDFITPGSPALSGVAVANGVVLFQTLNVQNGKLYALNAKDGSVLAEILTSPAISGPSVANGQVYMGTGVNFPGFLVTTGGSIIAFSTKSVPEPSLLLGSIAGAALGTGYKLKKRR